MDARGAITFIDERCRSEDRGYVTPCFVWQQFLNEKGYAQTKVQGERWRIHRLAYTLHVGPIPDGLTIDHLCRVKACCNPDHLEAVTAEENSGRAQHRKAEMCVRGHVLAEHRDQHGNCRLCARERRKRYSSSPEYRARFAAYMRKWNKAHPRKPRDRKEYYRQYAERRRAEGRR